MFILARSTCGFLAMLLLVNLNYMYAQPAGSNASEQAELIKIKGNVNSPGSIEFAPSISADGKFMTFFSNRNGSWKIFSTTRQDNNTWTDPEPIDNIKPFGNGVELPEGVSLSFDANAIYYSLPAGNMQGDIYYSLRTEDAWSDPESLGTPLNSPADEGFPSMNRDENTIYFTRSKEPPDGIDKNFTATCYDIYYSRKGSDGQWIEPRKLPYPVNDLCDKSPRILPDDRTLVFSSIRAGGAGNYDLYFSQLDEQGEWMEPVPIIPVNTPDDDQLVAVSVVQDQLFFARQGDLYTTGIPGNLKLTENYLVQGTVTDVDLKKGIGALIRVTNANNLEPLFSFRSNSSDGKYSLILSKDRSYNINISSEGYSAAFIYYNSGQDIPGPFVTRNIGLFNTVRLQISVRDSEIYEPVSANILVSRKGENISMLEKAVDPGVGDAVFNLPVGDVYRIKVSREGYGSSSFDFDVSGPVLFRDFEKIVDLDPAKINVPINVFDLTTNAKVPAHIVLKNRLRDEVIEINANEMIALRSRDNYTIEATTDMGYFFFTSGFEVTNTGLKTSDTRKIIAIKGNELNIKMSPVRINTSFVLKDVMFESNSSMITDDSYGELSNVVELMKNNPTLKVEIGVFTGNAGSERYNMALSGRRAESIAQYLSANDIPRSQLLAKGYGGSRTLESAAGTGIQSTHCRVELKVLEVFY